MINNLFNMVLITSFQATLVSIVILLAKKIFNKRISPTWGYLIWIIFIIKLIVPFGPESDFSIFNKVPTGIEQVSHFELNNSNSISNISKENNEPITQVYYIDENGESKLVEKETLPNNSNKNELSSISNIVSYIWILVCITILAITIISNIIFNINIRKYKVNSDNLDDLLTKCSKRVGGSKRVKLIVTDYITTPYLIGTVRPKILLPLSLTNLSDKEIEYIFLHELCHYKRKDIYVNYIMIVLQSIHWFNIFIWYSLKEIKESMEYATDEKVLSILEKSDYKSYGMTLINVVSHRNSYRYTKSAMGMANNKKDMKNRLINLKLSSKVKSKSIIFTGIGIILTTILALLTLTSSNEENSSNKTRRLDNEISKLDMQYLDIVDLAKESSVLKPEDVKKVFKEMVPTEDGEHRPEHVDDNLPFQHGNLEYSIGMGDDKENVTIGYNNEEQSELELPILYQNRNTGIFSQYDPHHGSFSVNTTVTELSKVKSIISSIDYEINNVYLYERFNDIAKLYQNGSIPTAESILSLLEENADEGAEITNSESGINVVVDDGVSRGFVEVNTVDYNGAMLKCSKDDYEISIDFYVREDEAQSLKYNIQYKTTNEDKYDLLIPSIENALFE